MGKLENFENLRIVLEVQHTTYKIHGRDAQHGKLISEFNSLNDRWFIFQWAEKLACHIFVNFFGCKIVNIQFHYAV